MTTKEKLERLETARRAFDLATSNMGLGTARSAMAAMSSVIEIIDEMVRDLPNPRTPGKRK